MNNTVYQANIRIERTRGPHRLAYLPALDGPVEFGVHGAIAKHYGAKGVTEAATTLDYVIAATGG